MWEVMEVDIGKFKIRCCIDESGIYWLVDRQFLVQPSPDRKYTCKDIKEIDEIEAFIDEDGLWKLTKDGKFEIFRLPSDMPQQIPKLEFISRLPDSNVTIGTIPSADIYLKAHVLHGAALHFNKPVIDVITSNINHESLMQDFVYIYSRVDDRVLLIDFGGDYVGQGVRRANTIILDNGKVLIYKPDSPWKNEYLEVIQLVNSEDFGERRLV